LFPVAEQVSVGPQANHVLASISGNGVLVYWGGANFGENQLGWHDRAGKSLGNVGAPVRSNDVALSPDEKMVVASRRAGSGRNSDIWLHELARGLDTRFTFDASQNPYPVWSPDGRRILFGSDRAASFGLYVKDTSGAGQDELLLKSAQIKFPTDWSADGRFVLYTELGGKTAADLWVLNMDGERKPVPFLQTPFSESQGQFSPDGHWIAYASDESGRYEVYIRPFPSGPGKWKISIGGGELPRWRRDGKELYFLSLDRKLMAAPVKGGSGAQPVFDAAAPQALFEAHVPTLVPGRSTFPYAATADGKRFLVVTGSDTAETPLTVVVNWLAAVKK
jgi:Tol biopolymer transport system component